VFNQFPQIFGPQFGAEAKLQQEAQELKAHYVNNPANLQQILHQNPELAQAVLAEDNLASLKEFIRRKVRSKATPLTS
jgi:hypothetical protein